MSEWIEACEANEVDEEDVVRFDYGGRTFAIYRSPDDEYFATDGSPGHLKFRSSTPVRDDVERWFVGEFKQGWRYWRPTSAEPAGDRCLGCQGSIPRSCLDLQPHWRLAPQFVRQSALWRRC
ncbi:Rieske 2Fe-2S domain-containing protein [Mesorhizobium sp.]|uniref:Rieske 2Fe-2S domain-containing protein n=1 Tax=Mesorhizobium sp. TaxID=1871066 RepID=UPI00345027F6